MWGRTDYFKLKTEKKEKKKTTEVRTQRGQAREVKDRTDCLKLKTEKKEKKTTEVRTREVWG